MTDPGQPPSDAPRVPPPPPSLTPPGMAPPVPGPPPGYVAYGGSGSVMHGPFRRVRALAKAIDVLLIITVPLQLIAIFGLFQLRGEAQDFLDGRSSASSFRSATQVNLSSLSGLLVIPIAVLTIIVMFRMAANLGHLGRPGQTWKPGWAIGGWFCPPCAIYVIPWLMFRELWRGSDPDVGPGDPSWKQRPLSRLVDVWWVLYGLVPVIGFTSSANFVSGIRTLDDEDFAQKLVDSMPINVGLAVVSVGTTVVFLLMMRGLARRHTRATGEATA
jgi:hypothetical protein